jgi:hypothetical protein
MTLLTTFQAQLTEAACLLSDSWGVTKEVWHDATRQHFETNVWAQFDSTTTASLEKLQALADTISQAEHEIP